MILRKYSRSLIVALAAVVFVLSSVTSFAQNLSVSQRAEAQRQLQGMSSDQIDQKIKQLGMTREEAERKAKENGIDLSTFLFGKTDTTAYGQADNGSKSQIIQSGPVSEQTIGVKRGDKNLSSVGAFSPPPTKDGLRYFGYDIFTSTPSAFEPNASGPVDAEYQIGPQDVLRVSIWGQVEQQTEAEVDKEGRIFIPTAGPVVVSGLTIVQATKLLTRQLSRSFQGLTSSPPTVWLDVTLAKIRPKRIFIMGEVSNPGGYTVNSYANIFNSLFAVGGPTVNGSLREVRLIRENKMVAKIDLYLYLTGAEKNNDMRVQNNDIIYVPVRKSTVYVKGEIRRPGIYELLPGENLKKLIEFAGGSMPSTYLERVQVERIIPLKERKKTELEREVRDIDFREIVWKNTDERIIDGDVVTFFPILNDVKNYVTISGSVFKPGKYQLTPKMKIRDLISLADSLKPETYFVRGELTRYEKDDKTKTSIPFDLHSVMEDNPFSNIELQPKDDIVIHDIGITREVVEFVDIYGSVKNPGRYSLTQNMTLTDVLMLAEGYSEDAWTLQAEIARLDKKKESDTLTYIYFSDLPDLRDTLAINDFKTFREARNEDLHLKHRDKIFIRPDPNFRRQQLVAIGGEVNFPGSYVLITHNEYLSEIIRRSGGKTNAAYLRGSELYRSGERVNVDFQLALSAPKSGEDIVLHPGDSIYVPKRPNSVKVRGEVNNPSVMGFIDERDMWDYIDRAGGLTDSADYILVFSPTGNVERYGTGWFSGNTTILDGSSIVVTKVPVPPPEKPGESTGQIIRDLFAIAASMLTVLVLARQL